MMSFVLSCCRTVGISWMRTGKWLYSDKAKFPVKSSDTIPVLML